MGAILRFIAEILFDIFFDIFFQIVCVWTGEIILFALTLSRRQPDFEHPSGWSAWLGLAFWLAIVAGIVFALMQLGILKF